MKYIKTFESLVDDYHNETDEDKKLKIALQILDSQKSMETDFEVGDYIKYREDHKKGREFDDDFFIVHKIQEGDRPKKYRDKWQEGWITNIRTGARDYNYFRFFEKCTDEEVKNIPIMLKAIKYNI